MPVWLSHHHLLLVNYKLRHVLIHLPDLNKVHHHKLSIWDVIPMFWCSPYVFLSFFSMAKPGVHSPSVFVVCLHLENARSVVPSW
jgi:hypothetical protein